MSVDSVLLFGGSGFVGGNLAALAEQRGWSVVIADLGLPDKLTSVGWRQVDITQGEAVEQVIAEGHPSAVVNLAALADIDRAERERPLAWQINVIGAIHIAAACSRRGIRHVFFSSDAVFDGAGGPYGEEDERRPLNYYGVTKAEAENAVLAACPHAAIIRISLVLGFPVASGNSFLAGLESKLAKGLEVLAPVEEIRTPLDVLTLGECVLELAAGSYAGVLHVGCTQSINRYALTRLLARRMGYAERLVVQQETGRTIPGRAPRHKNGILDVSRAQQVLKTPLPDLETTIRKALSTRKSVELNSKEPVL